MDFERDLLISVSFSSESICPLSNFAMFLNVVPILRVVLKLWSPAYFLLLCAVEELHNTIDSENRNVTQC